MARKPAQTQGSALISALFIMTLVAIAATAMSTRLQLDIYRTRLTLTTDKLYLASQAVTFWAMDVVASHQPVQLQKNDATNTHSAKKNSFIYPKLRQQDYPDITTTGQILDLQARFNLNQLVLTPPEHPENPEEQDKTGEKKQKAYQDLFLKLLNNTLTENQPDLNRAIVQATTLWVNPPPAGQGQDANTAYYLKQKPPYTASYQPMQSVSEFRLVQGVDENIYQTLRPYITALPTATRININTAPQALLMALGPGLSEAEADMIIQARGEHGIATLNEVSALLLKLNIPLDQIAIDTDYFLVIATTRSNDRNLDLELTHDSILKRITEQNNKTTVHIIHDSLNEI